MKTKEAEDKRPQPSEIVLARNLQPIGPDIDLGYRSDHPVTVHLNHDISNPPICHVVLNVRIVKFKVKVLAISQFSNLISLKGIVLV